MPNVFNVGNAVKQLIWTGVFRDRNHVFSGLTGVHPSRFNVRGEGLEAETVDGKGAIGNFFRTLGVQPAIGRLIGPGDDRMGAADSGVAVVSWSYRKNKFSPDHSGQANRCRRCAGDHWV